MMAAAPPFSRMPGVSPGVYNDADFAAISEMLYAEAGIVLPAGKAMLVYSRLAPLVRNTACGTFAAFVALIRDDAAQRRKAVCALTTNHTFFFREVHHFNHFAADVRPQLLRRTTSHAPIRIWSAGCSSGEETWSIALTLLGEDRTVGNAIAGADVAILATDLADHALATARAATYSSTSLEPVPAALRRNWVVDNGDLSTIKPEARGLVRFRTLNLLGDWPLKAAFDVIFCRNVMIYFDQPTKERLLDRFCDQLAPGAFLYIGHSERVTGRAADRLSPVGQTIYRRNAR